MRPDFVDQAHRDPSLGRLRPRAIPKAGPLVPGDRILSDVEIKTFFRDVLELRAPGTDAVEPGPVKIRDGGDFRRLDVALTFVIVFAAAVYFTAHILVSAGICPQ